MPLLLAQSANAYIDEASMVADDTFDMIHDTLERQLHRPLVIIAGKMSTTAATDDQRPYDPDHVYLEEPPPARSLPDSLPVPTVPVHQQGVYGFLAIHPIESPPTVCGGQLPAPLAAV